jgi:hypothetical protein
LWGVGARGGEGRAQPWLVARSLVVDLVWSQDPTAAGWLGDRSAWDASVVSEGGDVAVAGGDPRIGAAVDVVLAAWYVGGVGAGRQAVSHWVREVLPGLAGVELQ